jgi:hypothetical protein
MFRRAAITIVTAGNLLLFANQELVPPRAWNAITAEALLKHIRILSSDEFEGRAPATPGEQKTVDYLVNACRTMKLAPGNPDGTYLQKVALWGITPVDSKLSIKVGGLDFPLAADEARISSLQPKSAITVPESAIVFAGYGVVAPEYGWDDYKGLDVKGKAVIILAGDPPVPDPHDPAKLDAKMFLGPELSFYGRPGSKADLAHRRGATAVITITGGPASRFPTRPPGAGAGPNRYITHETMIVRDASSTDRIDASVSLNNEKAITLFAASGLDLNTLREAAVSRDFKPVSLRASLLGMVHNQVREIETSTSSIRLIGITWDGRARIFSTAPATMPPEQPAFWNWLTHLLNCPSRRGAQLCSYGPRQRSAACWAPNITCSIRYTRWRRPWPTSTSITSATGAGGERRTSAFSASG